MRFLTTCFACWIYFCFWNPALSEGEDLGRKGKQVEVDVGGEIYVRDASGTNIVWGQFAGGCRMGFELHGGSRDPRLTMFLETDSILAAWAEASAKTKLIWKGQVFWPTNMFYGPMKLCDQTGRIIPEKKPEVNDTNSYPAHISLTEVRGKFSTEKIGHDLGIPPVPMRAGRLKSFKIRDYWHLKESGRYNLTIFPKVYVRDSSGSDVCTRVDLPPLQTNIFWDENPESK